MSQVSGISNSFKFLSPLSSVPQVCVPSSQGLTVSSLRPFFKIWTEAHMTPQPLNYACLNNQNCIEDAELCWLQESSQPCWIIPAEALVYLDDKGRWNESPGPNFLEDSSQVSGVSWALFSKARFILLYPWVFREWVLLIPEMPRGFFFFRCKVTLLFYWHKLNHMHLPWPQLYPVYFQVNI